MATNTISKRYGIILCRDITMEEAWSKYAVKKRSSKASQYTRHSENFVSSEIEPIISIATIETPSSRRSDPKIAPDPMLSRSLALISENEVKSFSNEHNILSSCSGKEGSKETLRPKPPDTILHRNESCNSKSSYASDSSWLSSGQAFQRNSYDTSRFSKSRSFRSSSIEYDNTTQLEQHCRNRSIEIIVPTSKSTNDISSNTDFFDEQSELQSQLGRPTDSDDSPYAICSQYRLRPRFNFNDTSETSKVDTMRPGRRLLGDLRKSLLLFVNKTCSTKKPSVPQFELELNTKLDSSSASSGSSKVESIYYSDDEAGKLWKSLEYTLGINLDCRIDSREKIVRTSSLIRKRVETGSRIPRPQTGYRPALKSVDHQNHDRKNRRVSRLPIATFKVQKQCWEPKEKRDSGAVLNEKLLPPRTEALVAKNSVNNFDRSSDLPAAYVGNLPLAEKLRREDAMRLKCWGESLLRLAC